MRYFVLLLCLVATSSTAKMQVEKLVKANWIEVKSDNFIVITDAKPKLATLLVSDLERFRYFITETLGKDIVASKPLMILAISSNRNFKRLDLPEFWAGVFRTGLNGDFAIANISDYSKSQKNKNWGNQVLMHEYVHYAARNISSGTFYPLWYNEGVAEYLASFRMEDKGKFISIGSLDVIGQRLYDLRTPTGSSYEKVDVEDLFKTTSISMGWRRGDSSKQKRKDQKTSSKFYARAMITYHFLKSDAKLSRGLGVYLNLINQGKSVDYAFEKSFGLTFEEMDDAIHEYVSGRFVKYVRFDVEKANIKLPEVTPSLKKLTKPEIYSYLTQTLLRISSYTYAEKDAFLSHAQQYTENDAAAKIAEINYLRASHNIAAPSNIESLTELTKAQKKRLEGFSRSQETLSEEAANDRLTTLRTSHPNNAGLISLQAYNKMDSTLRMLKVGHPKGTYEFKKLRNLARQAINLDGDNGRGYYVLGVASANSSESRPPYLQEAADALFSARLLLGVESLRSYLWDEVELQMLLGHPDQVLHLSRQYKTMRDNKWINHGYGRFFVEGHEARATPFQKQVSQEAGKIVFADGSIYEGEIKNDLPHGKGKLMLYFGGYSEGTWDKGFLVGQGRLTTSNDFTYTGNFVEGAMTGTGRVDWPEGSWIVYSEGEFLMGMEHGPHRYVELDGRIFDGPNWLGSYHGEITVLKDDEVQHTFTAFRGAIRTQVNDDLLFAGQITKQYEAHGKGSCYSQKEDRVWPCEFENGSLKTTEPIISVTLAP